MTLLPVAFAAFLLAFSTLFSIVNPISGAIIFNQATDERTHTERLELARRVGFNSALVMLVSLWAGSYILNFFGITLNALRIAGGIVVAIRAYQMLSAPEAHEERKQAQASAINTNIIVVPGKDPADDVSAIAFFPLTLPFTTGPGTISVAIALGTERPDYGAGLFGFFIGASCAAITMAVLIWVFYALADRLGAFLGLGGRQVVTRLAAFLLLGIGVQIIVSGAVPVLHQALHS